MEVFKKVVEKSDGLKSNKSGKPRLSFVVGRRAEETAGSSSPLVCIIPASERTTKWLEKHGLLGEFQQVKPRNQPARYCRETTLSPRETEALLKLAEKKGIQVVR